MASFNISALQAVLLENLGDIQTIFGLKVSNGFDEKRNGDFLVMPTRDKVPLVRDSTNPILQPGRTGTTNFTNNAVELKSRIGEIKPFKADLKLDEVTLYNWSRSYLAKKKATDPSDIYSFEAMTYYMGRILAQAGKDISNAVYKGVHNPAGGVGGVHLFDGLNAKMLEGFTTVANGGVEDIPATNVYAAANTINQANILGEINKAVQVIVDSETLAEYVEEDGSYYLPFQHYAMMKNALAAQPVTKGDEVVMKTGTHEYRLSLLPNTIIKHRPMLNGTQSHFWTPDGNLFFLAPEGTTEDISSITIENADRSLKIFMDGEAAVDYADGRLIVKNNKW
ncbi:MAG: hypothetical protein MUF12_00495 [Sediminibacterium sp.]|jgi:hypothetical protein|nr:hypothetical protein [Sediminibacterium sp.]